MSKIGGKFAIIRDSVGKILDVARKPEDNPEKQVVGKFASVKFPDIKRGVIVEGEGVKQQSEEV